MYIRLWCKPHGQQRPRSVIQKSRKTGKQFIGYYYTKTQTARNRAIHKLLTHRRLLPAVDYPCILDLDIYVHVPKSYSKKRRETCLRGLELPAKYPDIDNIRKWIYDALVRANIVKDDRLIVGDSARKKYSEKPHIGITIRRALPKEGEKNAV